MQTVAGSLVAVMLSVFKQLDLSRSPRSISKFLIVSARNLIL